MKKMILITIVLFMILQLSAQQSDNNGLWLVILNGFKSKQEAIIAKNKHKLRTTLLYSSNYSNLNPGWYILTLLYDSKQDALKKSKELNANGEKSYVKFSGLQKTFDKSLANNVKFILNNRYVVLTPLKSKLSYEERSHELDNKSSTIDLISSVDLSELEDSETYWYNHPIYLVNKSGEIINSLNIRNFYVFSRIQIEYYRPPWRNPELEEEVDDSEIMKYIWDNESGYNDKLLVAEIEYTDAMLAISTEQYTPSIYKSAPQAIPQETEQFKILKNNSDQIQIYTYQNDTVCIFHYPFRDGMCGDEFINYNLKAWKVGSNTSISVPYDISDIEIDLIIKFENINKTFIFKQNKNQSVLLDLDGRKEKKLPFNFNDPWEC